MATIGNTNPTWIDVAKRLDPGGKIDMIVELLSETNEILQDATAVEGNLPTGHRTTIRSGLPSVTWRLLNFGVQPSKSTTVQVTEAAGMLEAYAEVDKKLAELNGNTAEFRLSEDRAFLEAMNQEMADTLFYGNSSTDPEEFMGLSPRYNSTTAENGDNIILGSSNDTDNTSIWLIVWGPNTVHMFYPKGSTAGLTMEDLGEVTLLDSATPAGKFQGYRSHYKWEAGASVRDWRFAVRIANIEVGDLTGDASAGDDLQDLMIQALELPPSLTAGRAAFYCNRTIKSYLRRQINNKTNLHLTMDEIGGRHVMAFDGIPVRRCDALLETEALVS